MASLGDRFRATFDRTYHFLSLSYCPVGRTGTWIPCLLGGWVLGRAHEWEKILAPGQPPRHGMTYRPTLGS